MDKNIIYLGDSKISSAERDRLLRDKPLPVTTAELIRLAEGATARHAEFTAWIKPRLTYEVARQVKLLRCDCNDSFRIIAGVMALEMGADWGTNQIAGVALCEAAAEFLGENCHAWPWEANQA